MVLLMSGQKPMTDEEKVQVEVQRKQKMLDEGLCNHCKYDDKCELIKQFGRCEPKVRCDKFEEYKKSKKRKLKE